MLTIDGSLGEGGGQILRTSLGLSLATGQPFRIDRIRAGRKQPGLLRQHLTAVHAAAAVGNATLSGDALGSQSLTFTPGRVTPGDHTFAVGTAGSTTLVLQTVLPALIRADAPSRIVLEGGTHNTHAPPYEFLERAFLPLLDRTGAQVACGLERHGFYPAGGGRFTADVTPAPRLSPLSLLDRGDIQARRAVAKVANLPGQIARRELDTVAKLLNWTPDCLHSRQVTDSLGPGNILLLEVASDHVTEVFSAFGRLGVPAEVVAAEAVACARDYLASGAAVGEHLADQLLLPLALAGEGAFTASTVSRHARTNMDTISRFLPVRFSTARVGSCWRVDVES